MARPSPYRTRTDIARPVAKSLREFGYPDASTEMVKECLDAWLDGKRDLDLPHGIIGAFASRQFDEAEEGGAGNDGEARERVASIDIPEVGDREAMKSKSAAGSFPPQPVWCGRTMDWCEAPECRNKCSLKSAQPTPATGPDRDA